MIRGATGDFVSTVAGGVACQAFVPRPLPPVPGLAIDSGLQARIELANQALGRLDAVSALLPDARLFLYSYVRLEAVMSSQIEGTQSSLSDLLLYEMESAPGVPIDDVQEVSCYVKALELGMRRLREGIPLSRRLICEMHATLMTSGRGENRQPGAFRKSQVWVGGHRPDQAVFVPPPASNVPDAFAALERFLNDVDEPTAPLLKAAMAHVQFETIHPFLDGNGRLGRLLIGLILAEARVLGEPLLYVSLFFKRHRSTYYDLLQEVRKSGDWERWIGFFADAIADTATQAVRTAQNLSDLHRIDKDRISSLGRLAGSAARVLDALSARPISNIASLVQASGITPATAGKVMDALEGIGIVRELTGHKRNRVFAYTAYVEVLNQAP